MEFLVLIAALAAMAALVWLARPLFTRDDSGPTRRGADDGRASEGGDSVAWGGLFGASGDSHSSHHHHHHGHQHDSHHAGSDSGGGHHSSADAGSHGGFDAGGHGGFDGGGGHH